MPLLHHKSLLAVAAVTDVALNARNGPVSGKALAKHHHLRSSHLEPVLQALVQEGILKAVRGPGGGYVLAREQRRITADDVLRAARPMQAKRKMKYSVIFSVEVLLPLAASSVPPDVHSRMPFR
jgi:Rrf2 family protein